MPDARRDPLQHGQVEVDRVPAGDHVGVERRDALAERVERRCSRSRSAWRVPASARSPVVDDQHFVDARRDTARSRAGARPWDRFRCRTTARAARARQPPARSVGLSKTPRDARGPPAVAFARDLAAAFDAALDEVARSEAHVGLERVDAGSRAADRAAAARRAAPPCRCGRPARRRTCAVGRAPAAGAPSARARSASAART